MSFLYPKKADGFKGKMLNSGVYVFLLEMEFINGDIRQYSGDITLLR